MRVKVSCAIAEGEGWHGVGAPRKNTSWTSVCPPPHGTIPPAATYTPPLHTAAWIPWRAVGMGPGSTRATTGDFHPKHPYTLCVRQSAEESGPPPTGFQKVGGMAKRSEGPVDRERSLAEAKAVLGPLRGPARCAS